MAIHSSILAWRIPDRGIGQRSLAGYSPWCHKELDTTEQLTLPLKIITTLTVYFTSRWEVGDSILSYQSLYFKFFWSFPYGSNMTILDPCTIAL